MPFWALLAQMVLIDAQSIFLCVSVFVLPVAGEEVLFIGDVLSSLGSVVGCSGSDEP